MEIAVVALRPDWRPADLAAVPAGIVVRQFITGGIIARLVVEAEGMTHFVRNRFGDVFGLKIQQLEKAKQGVVSPGK